MKPHCLCLIVIVCVTSAGQLRAQSFRPFGERELRLVQSISLSHDGDTLYCALPHREIERKKDPGVDVKLPELALYHTVRQAGGWSVPEVLPFSGTFKDYEPTLIPAQRVLLFNSNRPIEGVAPEPKNNIWFSTWADGTWAEPKSLYLINTTALEESYPTVASDGTMLYVSETIENDQSTYGIRQTTFRGEDTPGGSWLTFDGFDNIGDPCIAPDGSYLILTHFDPANWQGTCDLYLSFRNEKGHWEDPIPLQMLNSAGPDYAAYITADEETIYYRKNYAMISVPWQEVLKGLSSAY